MLKDGRWRVLDGNLFWLRNCGSRLDVRFSSEDFMMCSNDACPDRRSGTAHPFPSVANTPMSHFFKLLRRRCAGTRGHPLLGDTPFLVQSPVIHCTGNFAKVLICFMIALRTQAQHAAAREHLYNILRRSNMGGLYLREFIQIVAHIVAFPSSLRFPLDGAVLTMLQLSHLLTSCRQRAISTEAREEREQAAATRQIAAALFAPLFTALTPFDPVTRKTGIFSLYRHAALAHMRDSVGE